MIYIDAKDHKGFHLLVTHEDGIYNVKVTSPHGRIKSESFAQNFTPTFGMDTTDHSQAVLIGEKLALTLEQDENEASNGMDEFDYDDDYDYYNSGAFGYDSNESSLDPEFLVPKLEEVLEDANIDINSMTMNEYEVAKKVYNYLTGSEDESTDESY